MRILIVEDEFNIADAVATRLKEENYNVDISTDGVDGLDNALTDIYDLIILDVMLPNIDGFTILSKLKENNIVASVIMLTARDSLEDKLVGFSDGADDYITKPFHLEELVARVNSKLRKNSNGLDSNLLEVFDLSLNLKTAELSCKITNDSIMVMCKEFLILEYLMRNSNQIVTKDNLYDKVWGINNDSISNNLEAYISFIRKKLNIIGSNVNIKAIRGLGYKLEVKNEKVEK